MNMFGYGDGGSGCTEEMIEMMHRFDKLAIMPKCTHMGGAEFLEKNLKNNKNLEMWDGELYLIIFLLSFFFIRIHQSHYI